MTIRMKVRLRPNQKWSDKILKYSNTKGYKDWRILESEKSGYVDSKWVSEELSKATIGYTYSGEVTASDYEYEIMTQEEYDEWTTMSG